MTQPPTEDKGWAPPASQDRVTDERSQSSLSPPSGSVPTGAWTQGDWTAEQDEFGDWHVFSVELFDDEDEELGGDQTVIVEGVEGWPENEANACLIAAAPKLYAELARLDPTNPVLAKARETSNVE